MGAFTTVRSYAVETAPVTTTGTEAVTASGDGTSKLKTVATLLGEIAEYIPAEGLVAYLSAYSIVINTPGNTPFVAGIAGLVVGVVAVLLFGLFSVFSISKSKRINRTRAGWGAAVSVVLLLLYVALLPGNVLASFMGALTWLPALAALIATVALGLWGDKLIIFGKTTS